MVLVHYFLSKIFSRQIASFIAPQTKFSMFLL